MSAGTTLSLLTPPVEFKLVLAVRHCLHTFKKVYDLTIQSNPPTNGGFIQTEPESTVSLTCTVDGSAGAELQWYRNGRLVNLKKGNNWDVSHLCVEPVTKGDNGAIFTCKLKTNPDVNTFIQLEVNYPPNLNGTEEVLAGEKSDIVLSCDVQANPSVTVVWKKDSELLDLSLSNYKTSNNGITAALYISNINHKIHQAVYSCETTSSIYGVKSKNFKVIVGDEVMKFPLGPAIAGVVILFFTFLLAVFSRWKKIVKCFKKD
ncbi:transmembrane and immunoglobulin domain-containing protein 1 [Trichomycterus rosablanca]|uniref:transmembrane and immunoglobulin domain-containing protein 1 n=1 Tax=Trichomycterus rosablanca TaxID=2290929 RepID=UPI002F355C14